MAATKGPARGAADLSFINSGGVRTDLVPNADGSITYAQIFALEPFGNNLVVKTLTGAQLHALLEQQFVEKDGVAALQASILIPSANFSFAYDLSKPAGQRIVAMTLAGKPIDPAGRYRVTINNFLASGGDGYSVLTQGHRRVRRGPRSRCAGSMAGDQPGGADGRPHPQPHPGLAERRLVEAPELAAVKRIALALEHAERLDSDPQVLADRPVVESVGLAGQLELAVERLVRHAQQGPVGDAEAIALGRDRRRFHVDRDRAALVEAPRREGVAKLPIAVVGGDHRARAQPLLELSSVSPVTSPAASNIAVWTSAMAGIGISTGSMSSSTWSSRK